MAKKIEIVIDPKAGTIEWETHGIAENQECDAMLKVFQRDNEVLGSELTGGECLEQPEYDYIQEGDDD